MCEKPWNKGVSIPSITSRGGSGRSLGTATNEDTHLIWWYRLGRQSAYLQHYGFQLRRLDIELRQHFRPHGKRLSQEPPRRSCLHIHINFQHVMPKMLLLTGISLKSWIIHDDIMTLFISSHLMSLPSGCSTVWVFVCVARYSMRFFWRTDSRGAISCLQLIAQRRGLHSWLIWLWDSGVTYLLLFNCCPSCQYHAV